MSEPYIGEIRLFGFSFPPRNWTLCQGQLIAISQNTALFSLLGTTYGGNGTTTFALPDLRSRVAVGQGQGSGLSSYVMGEMSGAETVTLLSTQIPAHTHTLPASTAVGTDLSPSGGVVAAVPRGTTPPYVSGAGNTTMTASGVSGGSQPHSNLQPYLCLNYAIAVAGIFPSRN